METSNVVAAALRFYQLNSLILYYSEDNFILFRIFWCSIPLLPQYKGASESTLRTHESTSCCSQPILEFLGASGRIGKSVQIS